jgi:hypothetical protein
MPTRFQTRRALPQALSHRYPNLAAEFHPALNGPVQFDELTSNSTLRVWWQCTRIPSHIWQASIKSRTSKHTGCRRCQLARKRVGGSAFEDRTLTVHSPAIAATWHPTQNGPVTPDDVTFRSRFRAWWQCPDHPDHVWDATVHDRHHSGCPYCAGHRVRKTGPRHTGRGDLATTHPALVREWHTTRNGTHRSSHFTAGSTTVVWWQCPRNPTHIYQASVRARARKRSPATCPDCAAIRRAIRAITRHAGTGMSPPS